MSECFHESFYISADIDQERMTLSSVIVECKTCGRTAVAADDEVTLYDWSHLNASPDPKNPDDRPPEE